MEMFIIGMVVGFALAWLIIRLMVESALDRAQKNLGEIEFEKLIQHMEQELEQKNSTELQDTDKIKVTLERHNNTFMVYDSATSMFLAQGQDYQEVVQRMTQLYPEQLFEIVSGDHQAIQLFMESSESPTTA
jgi:uncharacterized membrane-anchored protein YhcB (DUF1043 family)